MLQGVDGQPIRMRARSNSADSWTAAIVQITRKDEHSGKAFAEQASNKEYREGSDE